jgi:hypothetical protein
MTVIPFKDARARLRPGRPVQPPAALGAKPQAQGPVPEPADAADDRLRMQQNLAALAVLIVLVVSFGWVIDNLRHYSRIQTCIEAGHRNCLKLDVEKLTAR